MKRSPMPQRTTPLKRSPIRSSNPTRSRKRKARHAKQRRETDGPNGRAETLKRDWYRCTAIILRQSVPHVASLTEFATGASELPMRCRFSDESGASLHEHHVDYKRSIRVTLCQWHHAYIESRLRWFKRGRR